MCDEVRHRLLTLVALCLVLLAVMPAPVTDQHVITVASSPVVDVARTRRAEAWFSVRARLDAQFLAAWTPPQPQQVESQPVQGPREGTEGTHHRGYATAKECVSMVEHGGSYTESDNPTHKGRYQMSRSIWVGNGGVPEHWDDWSLTSPAEQDAVFETAWYSPVWGPSHWLPYDGCGPYDGS